MKRVTYHWTEMRVLEVPDECPTDGVDEMLEWLSKQEPCDTPYGHDPENFCVKKDSRDFEIVDVEEDETKIIPTCCGGVPLDKNGKCPVCGGKL